MKKISKEPKRTIHTSRTLMFAELARIMDHGRHGGAYLSSLDDNVISKTTRTNQAKTNRLLTNLYGFDLHRPDFKAFAYFWGQAGTEEQPILALIYALGRDYLLEESISVVHRTALGERVAVEKFEDQLEQLHPQRFSPKTLRSVAQNLASSWKQAGFITGKVKNIRTQPEITHTCISFAMLLAYLAGKRGEFILDSPWVKALGLSQDQIRALAYEATKRDLLQYNSAGEVTSISFDHLLNKLDIHGI
ncbi:MAG: hypothetical protein IPJ06_00580 [Saprospiraceae bacterium]|nr:hypothetical protein [Saprospiraceae bacterium]